MKKSKGLGDTLEKIFSFFGIDLVAKKVAQLFNQDDCGGCVRRRDKLNKYVPYSKSYWLKIFPFLKRNK
jgi:hypothetical protein